MDRNAKVVGYKTLFKSNWTDLDAVVNQYIKNGWDVYGHQYKNGGDNMTAQVMVKYAKQEIKGEYRWQPGNVPTAVMSATLAANPRNAPPAISKLPSPRRKHH